MTIGVHQVTHHSKLLVDSARLGSERPRPADGQSLGSRRINSSNADSRWWRGEWACERAFAPMADMEQLLRERALPLFSLETFTPLHQFDVLGFTLHTTCATAMS